MWRLVGDDLNSNVPTVCVPGLKPGLNLNASFNRPADGDGAGLLWSTEQLSAGDELRVVAQSSIAVPGEMKLSATRNGEPVVLPTLMVRCSFAMELWPYVAVCGRVTALRLLVDE